MHRALGHDNAPLNLALRRLRNLATLVLGSTGERLLQLLDCSLLGLLSSVIHVLQPGLPARPHGRRLPFGNDIPCSLTLLLRQHHPVVEEIKRTRKLRVQHARYHASRHSLALPRRLHLVTEPVKRASELDVQHTLYRPASLLRPTRDLLLHKLGCLFLLLRRRGEELFTDLF